VRSETFPDGQGGTCQRSTRLISLKTMEEKRLKRFNASFGRDGRAREVLKKKEPRGGVGEKLYESRRGRWRSCVYSLNVFARNHVDASDRNRSGSNEKRKGRERTQNKRGKRAMGLDRLFRRTLQRDKGLKMVVRGLQGGHLRGNTHPALFMEYRG